MPKKDKSNSADKQDEPSKSTNTEDDEIKVQEAITSLRSLVEGEENLKVRMDDHFMLRYLRATGFKPQEAFEKMVKVYKYKAKHTEYFCTTSPSHFKEIIELNFMTLLEDRDHKGRRVILAKMGEIDTNATSVVDCIKLNDIWMELAMEEEDSQKNGMCLLVDLGGFPARLLRFLSPKATIVSALKEEMRPWAHMQVHIINTSKLLDGLVAIVSPLLTKRMKEQIHFHGQNWPSLHKFINPEILPEEYGGHKTEIDFAKMQNYLYKNEDKLKELFSLGYVKT